MNFELYEKCKGLSSGDFNRCVLELNIEKEVEAFQYYDQGMQKVDDQEVKELLAKIADDERWHSRSLEYMLDKKYGLTQRQVKESMKNEKQNK